MSVKIRHTRVHVFEMTVISASTKEDNLHQSRIESCIRRQLSGVFSVERSKIPVEITVSMRPKPPPIEERIEALERSVDRLLGPED